MTTNFTIGDLKRVLATLPDELDGEPVTMWFNDGVTKPVPQTTVFAARPLVHQLDGCDGLEIRGGYLPPAPEATPPGRVTVELDIWTDGNCWETPTDAATYYVTELDLDTCTFLDLNEKTQHGGWVRWTGDAVDLKYLVECLWGPGYDHVVDRVEDGELPVRPTVNEWS